MAQDVCTHVHLTGYMCVYVCAVACVQAEEGVVLPDYSGQVCNREVKLWEGPRSPTTMGPKLRRSHGAGQPREQGPQHLSRCGGTR